ncbi:hypothetical protein DMUE_0955 [Dictyocoela muelleri]|nr:hypothetical protein DMUE_0955 [Dictyocoela muelleri]
MRFFFKKPLLETHDAEFIINDDLITERIKKQHSRWNNKELGNAINYNVGDIVFKKIFDPDKINSKYIGPFKIVKLSRSGNNAYIREYNKISKVSIRNIKLFKRGEDVLAQPALTCGKLLEPVNF